MLCRFGNELFDPDNVLWGHLEPGDAWVDIVKEGIVRYQRLDAAARVALEAWLDARDGEARYDEVMERLRRQRDQWYTSTTWPAVSVDRNAGTAT